MSFEIERKFLVRDEGWRDLATKHIRIRQAYLRADPDASIRVRLKDSGKGTLTIKSKEVNLRRLELEYEVPALDAEKLLGLRQGSVIEKVRHIVPYHGLTWEVDVFEGENQGLVVAEVELETAEQPVPLPAWVGREVTAERQYYNSALALAPYTSWPHTAGGPHTSAA